MNESATLRFAAHQHMIWHLYHRPTDRNYPGCAVCDDPERAALYAAIEAERANDPILASIDAKTIAAAALR